MNRGWVIEHITGAERCRSCGKKLWGHHVFNLEEWEHYVKQITSLKYASISPPKPCFEDSNLIYTNWIYIPTG
jgi:hypothetical protein